MNLVKKFLEYAFGNGIVVILSLLSSGIVTRLISPGEKGKADLFVTYTSLLVLVLTMGIDQAFIRYYNDEKEENRGGLLRRSVKLPIILSIVISVICIVFYKPLSNYMVKETSLLLILLFGLNIIVSIAGNFAIINIRMKQKAKTYSLASASNKLSYILLLFLIYSKFNDNYITVVMTTVMGNLVMLIFAVLVENKDWFKVKRGINLNTTVTDLRRYGTPFIFSMGLTWIFQSADRISLQHLSTEEQIGLYGGAMTIVQILNTVQGIFTTFWTPVAYEKYSTNPEDTKFFSKMNEIVSFAMLILASGLMVFKDVIVMFLGSEYREARYIFPFLVLMPIMYTISETTVLGINFKKQTKNHIYIAVASAGTNIIGNILLVPSLGARGAAISTGLAYVVFYVMRTYLGNKYYKIDTNNKKFFISVAAVYILAIFSSIYKFNTIILAVALGTFAVILLMYRSLLGEIFTSIKTKIKR
ncbi:oligosaccharide flippase family protein [Streptococcus sp.]|uniref:oligosaccharide flippase family protein n=1 Tax=Streptococcus sp. TaxID=1306 RepID=UPI00179166AD|nr:oligosaccharide flippase family protein [Streptococcus sp.]HHU66208.1 polysaccharide biosynthesis protein [Streptococcus sp.]